jgi:large subunit ribosomal protein L23
MLNVNDILRRPLVTEKSTRLRESNMFVIEVGPQSTKGDIRMALKSKFKVDALDVRTIKVRGKFRRKTGPVGGYQSNWKKAVVRLKPGQQITWEEVA